jgi:hypothetical protein
MGIAAPLVENLSPGTSTAPRGIGVRAACRSAWRTTETHALRAGLTIEELFNLTRIDRWSLTQIKEIVDFEEKLAGAKN